MTEFHLAAIFIICMTTGFVFTHDNQKCFTGHDIDAAIAQKLNPAYQPSTPLKGN